MPSTVKPPANLEALLAELSDAANGGGTISVREIRDAVGRRAFAPLLLLASLVGFTPLGVVPGVPTLLAIVVILVAGQLVIGCGTVWAPNRILKLELDSKKVRKAAARLKPFARFVDRFIRPRLVFLTAPPFSSVLAAACVLLALTIPPFEFVPLVDMPLWAALAALSLALFAHDGVLALIALGTASVGLYIAVAALL